MKKSLIILSALTSFLQAADGSLDPSFGSAGTAIFSALQTAFSALFIQTDGKILVSTTAANGSFLARITTSGTLDQSFGPGGQGYISLSSLMSNRPLSINNFIIQPDGKIVLVGGFNDTHTGLIMRLNPDASLDTTFNMSGFQEVAIPERQRSLTMNNLALDKNGVITAVGTSLGFIICNPQICGSLVIVRLNSDGSLDSSFPYNGQTYFPLFLGETIDVTSVAIDQNQNIVVAGPTNNVTATYYYIARIQPNGPLDVTFNPTGFEPGVLVDTSVNLNPNYRPQLHIQPDGKYIVGISNADSPEVIRYNTDGSLDTSFGTGGRTIPISPDFMQLNAVALQSNGAILILGTDGNTESYLTVRFTSAGQLDLSFNTTGIVTTPFTPVVNGTALALQQNGYIVGAGCSSGAGFLSPTGALTLVRYINSPALLPTLITSRDISGTAQPKSIVEVFEGSNSLCMTDDIIGSWSCSVTAPLGATLAAVAHYPAGYVNLLGTCSGALQPQSPLSVAIVSKYCPCL